MKKLIFLLCCTSCCILSARISKRRGCDLPMTTAGYFGGDMAGFNPEDRNAITNKNRIWAKGIIPFVIDKEISSLTSLITKAIEHYSNTTCISFIPRSTQTDYIYLTKSSGCWSNVGRQGGKQIVSLDQGCGHLGTIIHEMMHAVGFWHEQNRPDRDNYITVYYANIASGQAFNFVKFLVKQVDLLGSEYDYKSVMHYGEYSFSKDGKQPTIMPKQKGIRIGDVWEKNELSQSDIERIKKLYKC